MRVATATVCAILLAGCATTRRTVPQDPAAQSLSEARSTLLPPETRAADYLQAAALSAPRLGSGKEATPARETYNAAATELTMLLRSSEGGRLWNQPLTLTDNNTTYHLQLQSSGTALWRPDYFTTFELPAEVERKSRTKIDTQEGVGGALVGVRETVPRESFAPPHGLAAPVTATLDFKGTDAILALRQPANDPSARVEGSVRPLSADFSAPIAHYKPPSNLFLVGIMGALRGGNYMEKTGLYFLQPYDPQRIPVIFVHGLISTPFTWVQTINALLADQEIRKRYQFWVFAYPTGNPPLYSALRLREEMARADKLYPNHRPYVLVGHSMGGILSHMQVTTVTENMWEQVAGEQAKKVFDRGKRSNVVIRSLTFQSNPRVSRVVFVCTPHRGSKMAVGGLGRWGRSLIRLPLTLTSAFTEALTGIDLTALTGSPRRLPNSVSGLSPDNPSLKVVNSAPMKVPYHSIIGDRGKGDTPNSTDGIVPYSSSHLDGAQSELIVPGPHSSCGLPQTIEELRRILRLHLKSSAGALKS